MVLMATGSGGRKRNQEARLNCSRSSAISRKVPEGLVLQFNPALWFSTCAGCWIAAVIHSQ